MLPPFAHLSQTTFAVVAAAALTSLSLLVLPGAGGQVRPVPLLPALGQAVGAVSAPLEAPARAPAPSVRPPAPLQRAVATQTARGGASAATQRAHRAQRTHPVTRSAPPAAVAARVPAAASTFTQVRVHPRGKARALGHAKRAASGSAVGARGRGQGKALGHRHGTPPGHTKSAPAARPKSNGNGTGGGAGHGGSKR